MWSLFEKIKHSHNRSLAIEKRNSERERFPVIHRAFKKFVVQYLEGRYGPSDYPMMSEVRGRVATSAVERPVSINQWANPIVVIKQGSGSDRRVPVGEPVSRIESSSLSCVRPEIRHNCQKLASSFRSACD